MYSFPFQFSKCGLTFNQKYNLLKHVYNKIKYIFVNYVSLLMYLYYNKHPKLSKYSAG